MLNESRFELAYVETFDVCAPGIFQILGIKNMVMVSALGMLPRMYETLGMAELPSFMPGCYTPYSDDMTFLERLTNFKVYIKLVLHLRKWDTVFWEIFNAKYPGFPTIQEIINEKTSLIMANVNEFAESPRPKTKMIIYVGGSTLYDPKPLGKDFDKILGERNATVLFSLGSLALSKDIPGWLKNDIIETFAAFPNVTFIWKYEDNDSALFGNHPNIHPVKWVPQNDLLADKRLSLFVTHGGMNSMLEAMFHGKPMILIPLFGDQLVNARNVERIGTGTIIERSSLNKKTLTNAIQRTLGNK
ncbi:UDP-glucoronosyl and UDP-glucosyl transferase [Ancylostoma duodenale]|uniref:UDP-glucuronosyltransferase n=1 Tax=Ancylostoma duodenale TaxID=51022 RepID=A0A0C2DTC9_9BILA|nr:UDP-glucoronosyl and UDP-glucosyl transferase [Ancylostoma duodenale]